MTLPEMTPMDGEPRAREASPFARLRARWLLPAALVGAGVASQALVLLTHHRGVRTLPDERLLALVAYGGVLLVMVGEQAQEMQLARWLPTTPIPSLEGAIRPWMGLWFAVFPTVETLAAQGLAALLVLGSYVAVERRAGRSAAAA